VREIAVLARNAVSANRPAVTLPSWIFDKAQAGPMLACDWNGHSYSASTTRARCGNASSTLPTCLPSSLVLACGGLADMVVKRNLFDKGRLH